MTEWKTNALVIPVSSAMAEDIAIWRRFDDLMRANLNQAITDRWISEILARHLGPLYNRPTLWEAERAIHHANRYRRCLETLDGQPAGPLRRSTT